MNSLAKSLQKMHIVIMQLLPLFGLKGAKKWKFQICIFFIIHPISIEFFLFGKMNILIGY